jgi:hypothetical protein
MMAKTVKAPILNHENKWKKSVPTTICDEVLNSESLVANFGRSAGLATRWLDVDDGIPPISTESLPSSELRQVDFLQQISGQTVTWWPNMFHEKMLVTHQNLSFATIDEIGLQSNTKQTNKQTIKQTNPFNMNFPTYFSAIGCQEI